MVLSEALQKVQSLSRDSLLNHTRTSKPRTYPLIVKYNPSLPDMTRIVKKHLPILDLHPHTLELFSNKIFISFKIENSIKDILTNSRLKSYPPQHYITEDQEDSGLGCVSCDSCKLCKLYLKPSIVASSYNTSSTFPIKGTVSCSSHYVIYLVKDIICNIDYIGYSEDIKHRWANHKSHIKRFVKSCELATHINQATDAHILDRSSQSAYDSNLRSQLEIVLLEEVDIDPTWNKEKIVKKLQAREHHWQCNLKVSHRLGGICKR